MLVFWTSAALLAYGYVGYPALIYLLARIGWHPTIRQDFCPRVSLLVPAYNEAHAIRAKIDNCLGLDYPRDKLEVLMASDGSSDGTADFIDEAAKAGLIRGVVYSRNRGKAAVLNDLVALACGEILVFSDATTMLQPESVRTLVSNFADPRVGAVSGIYHVVSSGGDGRGKAEALYWRYETFIRQAESSLGRMLGAHGSLYAIRRELFEPLEAGTRNEDFIIPITILLKGYQSIYETRAVAWEAAEEMTGFPRRVSLASGNYQQMALLLKRRGWFRNPFLLFQLMSHKAARLLSPFLILMTYMTSAWLFAEPAYGIAFGIQTLFFIAAFLGLNAHLRLVGKALVAGPYYFCMVNLAGLVALQRLVLGKAPVDHKVRFRPRETAARARS